MFYFVFCVVVVLSTFGLSSVSYDVVLLPRFIYMRAIQINKIYLISKKYQIIVISILKN